MHTMSGQQAAQDAQPITPAGRQAGTSRWAGPAMMTGSALSNQLGAATAVLAFPVIGPAGVVAVRQWIAGIVLLTAGRPRWRSLTWPQWWPILLLAAVYGTMNLSLYAAIDRLGLGLAVTLEFLGPLAVALATSRRRADLACALVAGAGVVVLTRPRPDTDYIGIGLGLLAAACWASYILLNRLIGQRVPGAQGSATAAGLSALVFVPVGLVILVRHPPTWGALACAATAGILSSAVPLLVDLMALRRVPAHAFGIFMSVNPVLAAVIGLVILGQRLPWSAWLGIGAIVAANAAGSAHAASSAGPHGEDHGQGEDGRARDPGRAQPLPQNEGRQDGSGQGFEQGQKRGRAGGSGPQAAEIQRVGHGGWPGAQDQEQAEGGGIGPEAEAAERRRQRHQGQAADGEAETGHGRLVQPGHRPGTGQRDRGKAGRREHRHARAGQYRGLAEPGRQAHEQAEADQGQPGGRGGEPTGAAPGRPFDAEHDDRGGADGDQGGQRHRGQRHRREVATLVQRGQ
jgi:inner membrane transporter RhtA